MSREKREKRVIIWTDVDTYHEFYKLKDKGGYGDKTNHEFVKDMLKRYKHSHSDIEFTE